MVCNTYKVDTIMSHLLQVKSFIVKVVDDFIVRSSPLFFQFTMDYKSIDIKNSFFKINFVLLRQLTADIFKLVNKLFHCSSAQVKSFTVMKLVYNTYIRKWTRLSNTVYRLILDRYPGSVAAGYLGKRNKSKSYRSYKIIK